MRPLCANCKRYDEMNSGLFAEDGTMLLFCEAFPVGGPGIPLEILDGDFDHEKEYPGDKGLQFTPRVS